MDVCVMTAEAATAKAAARGLRLREKKSQGCIKFRLEVGKSGRKERRRKASAALVRSCSSAAASFPSDDLKTS